MFLVIASRSDFVVRASIGFLGMKSRTSNQQEAKRTVRVTPELKK